MAEAKVGMWLFLNAHCFLNIDQCLPQNLSISPTTFHRSLSECEPTNLDRFSIYMLHISLLLMTLPGFPASAASPGTGDNHHPSQCFALCTI